MHDVIGCLPVDQFSYFLSLLEIETIVESSKVVLKTYEGDITWFYHGWIEGTEWYCLFEKGT